VLQIYIDLDPNSPLLPGLRVDVFFKAPAAAAPAAAATPAAGTPAGASAVAKPKAP
jgi:hypothetical protein